jgi:hypothetical protein
MGKGRKRPEGLPFSNLQFSVSFGGVLARMRFVEKLTVRFCAEVTGIELNVNGISREKRRNLKIFSAEEKQALIV